jgi:hypothetical protein
MLHALGAVEVSATPFLLTILAAFALCFVTFAVAALLDSNQDTWLVRAGQRTRLARTRMHRMLKRRHIDVARYVGVFTPAELRGQVAACHECSRGSTCDRALRSRSHASRSSFSFCPNRPSIERYFNTPAGAP